MENRPLYAITAVFDDPDRIVHAVAETVKEGYTQYDVHTPYPVHGMGNTMKLKRSNLGYFALAFGLIGAVASVAFMSWVSLVEYPLVIGGKPFWSWPAFVPVAFEVTVLFASVLTVLAMVVLYFKFPNNSHPLHDTKYMARVSSDHFGICIQSSDPKFDPEGVTKFLQRVGGREITPIYYDLEEMNHGQRLFEPNFIGLLLVVGLVASAGTYFTLNHLLYMPPFSWMMEQHKLKAQAPSSLFHDGIGMRPVVEGTVSRGHMPYRYKGKPEDAGRMLANPLLATDSVLVRGKDRYLTFCSPCHGDFGTGDSHLRGQYPNPPTFHSDKMGQWPDGRIYHVVTEGQNIMPPYASVLSPDDRWTIVHYVRVLQRAHNPQESDLK